MYHTTNVIGTSLMRSSLIPSTRAVRSLFPSHQHVAFGPARLAHSHSNVGSSSNNNWPFAISREVNWGDMDVFRHVNNTVYIRECPPPKIPIKLLKSIFIFVGWFESARIEQLQKIGELLLKAPHHLPSSLQVVNLGSGFEPKISHRCRGGGLRLCFKRDPRRAELQVPATN